MLHDVGAVDQFEDAKMVVVVVGRREIGVVCWKDQFFAMRNICPHLGAPICGGRMIPFLSGGASGDELDVDHSRLVMVCPWHRWEFDARTGHAITGRLRIKTYPTTVKDGRVLVDA
jgi:nitrite reductase/ring-hydroxylating ferredoxin subunit